MAVGTRQISVVSIIVIVIIVIVMVIIIISFIIIRTATGYQATGYQATGYHGVEIQTPWLLAPLPPVLAFVSLEQLRKLHLPAPFPPVLALLSLGQLRGMLPQFCGLCISASYRTAPVNA